MDRFKKSFPHLVLFAMSMESCYYFEQRQIKEQSSSKANTHITATTLHGSSKTQLCFCVFQALLPTVMSLCLNVTPGHIKEAFVLRVSPPSARWPIGTASWSGPVWEWHLQLVPYCHPPQLKGTCKTIVRHRGNEGVCIPPKELLTILGGVWLQ